MRELRKAVEEERSVRPAASYASEPAPPPVDRLMKQQRAPEAAAVGTLADQKEARSRSVDADQAPAAGAGNAARFQSHEAAKAMAAPVVVSLAAGSEPSIALAETARGV